MLNIVRVTIVSGALLLLAGNALAVQSRTFEGRVTDVKKDQITLEVGGEKITVKGDERIFAQLEKGQIVAVQAQPDLEAKSVEPIEGAFAGDRLVGEVKQVTDDAVRIETLDGQEETVAIDSGQADKMRPGSNVVIELEEDPTRAKNWRATQVQPVQPGQTPRG